MRFNTRNIRETIDSFARGHTFHLFNRYVFILLKNADRNQNFLFDLIYFQRSGVYTH